MDKLGKTIFKISMAIFVIILTIFAFLSVVCVKNTLNILKNDAGYVVVLDAGHGAPDGGVVGTNTGVLESDLNLKMVKILQNYLENADRKSTRLNSSHAR